MLITNKKYIYLTVIISLTVGFLIHFPELVSLTGSQEQQTLFPDMSATDVLFEASYTFLTLLVLFALNTFLFGFNKPVVRMPWWKVGFSFVLTWILSKMFGEAFVFLHRHFNIPAIDAMVHHYLHPIRDFMLSLIVTGSCYICYLIHQHQTILLQNGELLAENVRNQYQALKNQLNPHMLFNSLNTLQSLVRESPEKAQDYIRELSRVLRYTLQENDTHIVTLRAFKVNSIDYLLKPIDKEEMHAALAKLERLHPIRPAEPDFLKLMRTLQRTESYKTHFLVPIKGDKLLPLAVKSVSYFYIAEGIVKAVTTQGKEYILNQTLDELTECLNPQSFFRANRQYLIAREAVKDITLWFNNRLIVNLYTATPEKIVISKNRVGELKEWLIRNG